MIAALTNEEMRQLVHETYAVQHLLHQLDFRPDDIYVGARMVPNQDPPGLYVIVLLEAQEKQFVYTFVRLCEEDVGLFERAWTKFASEQPRMDRLALDFIVAGTQALLSWHLIVQKLAQKGFRMPGERVASLSKPVVEAAWTPDAEPGLILVASPEETLRWRSKKR